MSELKYWIGFTLIPGIGPVRFSRIREYFGDLERAWQASGPELEAAGLDQKASKTIVAQRSKVDLEAEMEKLARYKVKVLTLGDASYPPRLREIYEAPPVLYVRGEILPEDEWALAVVGSRRVTSYGRQVTEELTTGLAQAGLTIVSGLARGVDTVAHRAALKAEGRTIAVLGCGLDMVYPGENLRLAQEIIQHGALISDYPLGTRPKPENFPRRNRIMSGLSLGVLVTEAMDRSGALITANLALEQDREVFAVPGNVFSPASRGCNRLIRDGAKLVQEVNDILEELNLSLVPQHLGKEVLPENEVESQIVRLLSREPLHIDEICRNTKLPTSTVASTLALMELKGMVRQLGGMNYVAVSP